MKLIIIFVFGILLNLNGFAQTKCDAYVVPSGDKNLDINITTSLSGLGIPNRLLETSISEDAFDEFVLNNLKDARYLFVPVGEKKYRIHFRTDGSVNKYISESEFREEPSQFFAPTSSYVELSVADIAKGSRANCENLEYTRIMNDQYFYGLAVGYNHLFLNSAIPDNFLWGKFIIDLEAVQATRYGEGFVFPHLALARYREMLDQVNLVWKNGSSRNFFKAWQNVKRIIYSNDQFNVDYCKSITTISSALAGTKTCTNCVGHTSLILALLKDSDFVIPEGWVLGVQSYNDHVEPVLYSDQTEEVFDLMLGSKVSRKTLVHTDEAYLFSFLLGSKVDFNRAALTRVGNVLPFKPIAGWYISAFSELGSLLNFDIGKYARFQVQNFSRFPGRGYKSFFISPPVFADYDGLADSSLPVGAIDVIEAAFRNGEDSEKALSDLKGLGTQDQELSASDNLEQISDLGLNNGKGKGFKSLMNRVKSGLKYGLGIGVSEEPQKETFLKAQIDYIVQNLNNDFKPGEKFRDGYSEADIELMREKSRSGDVSQQYKNRFRVTNFFSLGNSLDGEEKYLFDISYLAPIRIGIVGQESDLVGSGGGENHFDRWKIKTSGKNHDGNAGCCNMPGIGNRPGRGNGPTLVTLLVPKSVYGQVKGLSSEMRFKFLKDNLNERARELIPKLEELVKHNFWSTYENVEEAASLINELLVLYSDQDALGQAISLNVDSKYSSVQSKARFEFFSKVFSMNTFASILKPISRHELSIRAIWILQSIQNNQPDIMESLRDGREDLAISFFDLLESVLEINDKNLLVSKKNKEFDPVFDSLNKEFSEEIKKLKWNDSKNVAYNTVYQFIVNIFIDEEFYYRYSPKESEAEEVVIDNPFASIAPQRRELKKYLPDIELPMWPGKEKFCDGKKGLVGGGAPVGLVIDCGGSENSGDSVGSFDNDPKSQKQDSLKEQYYKRAQGILNQIQERFKDTSVKIDSRTPHSFPLRVWQKIYLKFGHKLIRNLETKLLVIHTLPNSFSWKHANDYFGWRPGYFYISNFDVGFDHSWIGVEDLSLEKLVDLGVLRSKVEYEMAMAKIVDGVLSKRSEKSELGILPDYVLNNRFLAASFMELVVNPLPSYTSLAGISPKVWSSGENGEAKSFSGNDFNAMMLYSSPNIENSMGKGEGGDSDWAILALNYKSFVGARLKFGVVYLKKNGENRWSSVSIQNLNNKEFSRLNEFLNGGLHIVRDF